MRSWLLVVALTLVFLGGCRLADGPPNLLTVLDVTPSAVDVGDQVEVLGSGFPEGRVGSITLRGDLHRPGQHPEPVVLTVRAATANRHRVTFDVSEELQRELCGLGKEARHTTFRGQLLVAFSPKQAGAPPVTGTLDDVVLDIAPPPLEPATQAAVVAEGRRAAEFFGFTVTQHRHAVVVSAVVPDGRAERAGLLENDQLLHFNGVVVHHVGDIAPASGQRLVSVSVKRGRLQEPVVRLLDADGFAVAPPNELSLAALLVGFVVCVMLFFVAPVSRLLTWVERRVAMRLRETVGARAPSPRNGLGWLAQAIKSAATEQLMPVSRRARWLRAVPYLQFLAVSAGFTLAAFELPLVAEDLDLPLVMLVSTTAFVTVGLMLGGWSVKRGWSLWKGLKSGFFMLLFQLPAIAVFSTVVLGTGSSRPRDLVATQGALPWEWLVFANPLLLVGLGVVLAAVIPEASRGTVTLPETSDLDSVPKRITNPASRCLMFLAEWGQVFVVAGIASLVLLGGWNVPGVSASEQQQSLAWQVLGAVLLQTKCWGLVLLVRGARWVLPRLGFDQMLDLYWRWLLPLTALVVVLTLGWSWGNSAEFISAIQRGLSLVLFGVTLFVAVYLGVRVFVNLRGKHVELSVNPWL